MSHYQRSVLGTVLILVITLCSGFLLNRWFSRVIRVDMTSQGLYTLTDGTRNILEGLDEQLTAKLFYSKEVVDDTGVDQYRSLNNFFYYTRDLLRAYEEVSDGKLKLEVYDPVAFSDSEGEADRLGIRRFPAQAGSGFYFGLAIESKTGEKEALAFLDPQRQAQLEYLISEAVERVTNPTRARVGVLSSLDVLGGNLSPMERQMRQMQGQPMPQSWQAIELLRRLYDVEEVAADATEIDSELNYLLVVHPKGLGDETLYAIDQFVMRGGKLICFVDPHAGIADPPQQNPQNPMAMQNHDASSSLQKLLSTWGVKVDPMRFVGDFDIGLQVRGQRGPTILGGYLGLNTKGSDGEVRGVNKDDVITQSMSAPLQMYFAGTVTEQPDAASSVELRPLLMATSAGRTFSATSQDFSPMMGGPDPQNINQKIDDGEPAPDAVIATRIVGKLKSAFPDGSPAAKASEDEEGAEAPGDDEGGEDLVTEAGEGEGGEDEGGEDAADEGPAHLAEAVEQSQVIVVADVDMLTDALALQRSMFGAAPGGGCEFLLNAVDALADSTDLLSIRSRGSFERPFTVVNDIERKADERVREEVQRINTEIEGFDKQIGELRSQANEDNLALLQNEAISKKRELENKKREAQRQLNEAQRARNEEIDSLESSLVTLNVVGVPAIVLLIGLALWLARTSRRMAVTGGSR